MVSTVASPWIRSLTPEAPVRLICLPHAGGGTTDFRRWSDDLPAAADLCPVVLPGRESRLAETPIEAMEPLVEALREAVTGVVGLAPYVLYGHSMGSWIAFELVRSLRRHGAALPTHLIVASRRAPDRPSAHPDLSGLDEAAFLEAVQQRYGAIPAVILEDERMRALFLPALRGDFTLLEGYRYRDEPPLPVPITALWSRQDAMVAEADVRAWRAHTEREFAFRALHAGHFSHRDAVEDVTPIVSGALRAALFGR